ncbi:MAG: IscS subfamily cysteine desulfurase [Candidatus Krumholzibacteriia bacterium]
MSNRAGGWRRAICGICPAGCWVEVRTEGGRLVEMRAEEGHPLGMICHRGRHAPVIVHGDHRLTTPLGRIAPKPDPRARPAPLPSRDDFTPITWDEAYDRIADALERIKRESGPEATAIYTGRGAFELSLCDLFQPAGVAVSSASSVLFPFGSPNTMGVGALCYVSFAMIAPHVTMGRMLVDMFTDIENADLLVVWGANPATDSPPLDMHRLEAAVRRGAEVVVIDPRRTETVLRTGAEWLPIRPGTDGALALGLLRQLVEDDLHDEDFARRWCHGFDELERYAQHFPPAVVEEITGVPAGAMIRLARRIGRARGACPVMYTGLEYSDSGVQAIRAVLTLFALAGHLDAPGGIGLAMPGSHFPLNRGPHQANPDLDRAVARDRFPLYSRYRGEGHASGLVTSVLEGEPYRIRGLLVHGASLLTSWPQTDLWRRTLSELDFLVCIDRQLTADAAWADVVLPATTMFEIDSYMTYGPIFRLRERVIEPVGEARDDYLIMTGLADRLGYGHLWPRTAEEKLRLVLDGSGFTLEDVRAAGGQVQVRSPVMEYRKWEKGRLRPDGEPGFATPTGKFEIWSTVLEEDGHDPLPRYTEPGEGPLAAPWLAADYPLVFNSGARPQTDFRSQHHGIAGLLRDNPEPTVDLHPDDAAARGIATGDAVEVRTPRGAVAFRARVTTDIAPGCVECAAGGGGPVGPEAWRRANVNELTDLARLDPVSGFPVYKALLCEVVRMSVATETSRAAAGRRIGMDGEPLPQADLAPMSPGGGSACGAAAAAVAGVAGAGRARAATAAGAAVAGTAGGATAAPAPRIYLDSNATTRVAAAVREAMAPFLDGAFGNPSALHGAGREAAEALDAARRNVARLVGARPRRIVFTGGGSEADNLAVKGVAFAGGRRGGHVITSAVEHPALLESCRFLERLGYRVTCLVVDADGRVRPGDLEAALDDDTFLVSIMAANNETGTVQPVAELAGLAHAAGALFHTDAVQAAGKIPVDVAAWDVDLLSLSAHKFHGPKGVGALYVKAGVELEPLVHGGRQEGGLRAGTENVAAIAGMGRAAELARAALSRHDRLAHLRDRLEAGILALLPEARRNGSREHTLPNTLNLSLPGVRGESLVIALDRRGIALSSGSACKAGSPAPTHVLLAMGRSEEEAHCSVRFSLDTGTTAEDVDRTVAVLGQVLREMEETVRFLPCK